MTTTQQIMVWLGRLCLRRRPQLVTRSGDGYFAFRVFAALVFSITSLHAHSFHQSTAEAEYNPTTKKLEVGLTVFINDLETALIRQSEREMRIDKNPAAEFDAQIQAYLAKTFVVTDAAGKAAKIEWVGRELDAESVKSDDPAVTLFFEIALPDGLTDKTLQHTVFGDLFKDQTHLLHLRSGSHKVELRFTRDNAKKKLLPAD
ncbi:MAG: hypothetical protein Q8M07_11120 [Prosthecobacter sp.]|nr:hypothetical protein [Prosthecobacter sp.]